MTCNCGTPLVRITHAQNWWSNIKEYTIAPFNDQRESCNYNPYGNHQHRKKKPMQAYETMKWSIAKKETSPLDR